MPPEYPPSGPQQTPKQPKSPRCMPWVRGAAWIAEGYELFKAAPGPWLGIAVLWLVILMGLAMLPFGSLIWSALSPVFIGGVLLGCRGLGQGSPLKIEQLFACFGNGQFGTLATLGVLGLAAQFLIALLAVAIIYPALPAGLASGHAGLGAIAIFPVMLGILLATALMLPLAMALWFAPALIALGGEQPVNALKLSLAASWVNMGAFTVYGLLMLVLIVIAAIPFGLGLLVAGPVLMGSIYAAYRDIFGDAMGDASSAEMPGGERSATQTTDFQA